MKMELSYIIMALVVGIVYYFIQFKLVFECKHPRSKKLILGMRVNLALILLLAIFGIMCFLVLYGQKNGVAIGFGKDFFLLLLASEDINTRRLLWLNMGVFLLSISTFVVALKISVKKRDYKNLRLERTLNSELTASFSCFAFLAVEFLAVFIVYIA